MQRLEEGRGAKEQGGSEVVGRFVVRVGDQPLLSASGARDRSLHQENSAKKQAAD